MGLNTARTDGAGATMDEEVSEFILGHQGSGALQRIALGDGAQIKHHAFTGEADGLG